ncbi:RNA-guided pseudouridylation complex pseudouridine synthase subunit Cbf5 [Candidatus Pacearchaeota archaeon]|nr:RNA-guided pseudouridylation complex pseudouridine synthase subunit Cbf5 [Candidatus Pacearchaeota archaeon]
MKDMNDLLNFGLINIDKPAGPTSYSVSEFVKRALGLKKTSHMGTLDPKVTGVLPITLGRACKLAGYFIRHDKSYVGILETHQGCDLEELQKLIDANFVGKIKQTPPHRAAVKREEREREVYYWKLLEVSGGRCQESEEEDLGNKGRSFLFECRVEGGTYVRKLCSDLGEMIGGAHMGELRRIEAGIFDESDLVSLDNFESAVDRWKNGDEGDLRRMVVPAEDAIRKVLPVVEVEKKAIKSLHIGRPLFRDNITSNVKGIKTDDRFAVFCGKQFVGIYRRTTEEIIFGRSEFVFN